MSDIKFKIKKGLHFNGNCQFEGEIFLVSQTVPNYASDTGIKGQKSYDNNYLYVCVADNEWKRSPLSSWP